MAMPRDEEHLTGDELAARWKGKVVVGTLTNWRSAGLGPAYIKLGRSVLYPLSAIEEYERANTVK
jgi:glucose/arabinose dehydrogenase